MRTVRDARAQQANALSVKLSDPSEPPDPLIASEGDGIALFDRTDMTQGVRELVAERAAYRAQPLEALRSEDAGAARVLRELVKNQRLG
jgi:hypothetical protein